MREKTALEQHTLERLHSSASRLVAILERDAPLTIIGNELGMLLVRGMGLFGKDMLDFVAFAAMRHERWRLGVCMEDDCGKMLEEEVELCEGLCLAHLDAKKKEAGDCFSLRKDMNKS